MLEVVIPYVEAAMPYVKSGAPYAAVSLAVLGAVTLVWQHRSRLQLMQELELAQSTHLASEAQPFAYDTVKAEKLRQTLGAMLRRLHEFKEGKTAR